MFQKPLQSSLPDTALPTGIHELARFPDTADAGSLKEFFNSDDYKKILEDSKKSSAKLQEYFNSDAFKKAMEDSKKKFLEEADKNIGFHSYSLGKTTLITSDKNSPEIFIDGFRASEGQLKALSPDKIESVTIYKNKDKTSGEIRVTTKK